MSAITGLWHLDGKPGAAGRVALMQEAQAPFGRDRAGVWDGGFISFASRLDLLLPEDVFDNQPLSGANGRYRLVADVRLDNRPELAAALNIDAPRARKVADAAMLLLAWERWGTASLSRFVGNFAFALWDGHERRLHLVRDHLADRPLFFHQCGNFIAFSSMYHGLHALPELPPTPDLAAVRGYAGFFKDRPGCSFYEGIERLERSTRLEIAADGIRRMDRYWDIPRADRRSKASHEQYLEAFDDVFGRAVQDRLRTTGTVACQLSAGRDSSAVAVTAAPMLAGAGGMLTAYTAVPSCRAGSHDPAGRMIDESPVAAKTAARHANIEHLLIGRDGRAIGEDFDATFAFARQPMTNPSNWVWLSDIWRSAQGRGHRVLLTGRAGNATISYDGHDVLPDLFARGRWWHLASELQALHRTGTPWSDLLRSSAGPVLPAAWRAWRMTRGTPTDAERARFSPLRLPVLEQTARDMQAAGSDETLATLRSRSGWRQDARIADSVARLDASVFEKSVLGAYRLDERDPTRDRRVIEMMLRMPSDLLLHRGMTRRIYDRIFADRVPAEVLAPPAGRASQGADWMYRVIAGRAGLKDILQRAEGNRVIEDMIDVPELLRLVDAPLDPATAHRADVSATYRRRLLFGVATADFLLRCGVC